MTIWPSNSFFTKKTICHDERLKFILFSML